MDARARPGEVPAQQQMAYLEVQQYLQMQLLRDADIMSMKHSLEIRTPLVDHVLYRELFKIPAALRQAGPAKRRLRQATRPPLAERYWKRKKWGSACPGRTGCAAKSSHGPSPSMGSLTPPRSKNSKRVSSRGVPQAPESGPSLPWLPSSTDRSRPGSSDPRAIGPRPPIRWGDHWAPLNLLHEFGHRERSSLVA